MRGKRGILFFCCLVSLVIFFSSLALAQNITYISDIINNPTRFMNMTVVISGRVQESNPAGPTTPGSFVLTDDSFGSITVLTYNPPAPGAVVTIEGVVQVDPTTQTPYVRELKVVSGGLPVSVWAIIAAAVVLILIVVFIMILRRPSFKEEKMEPTLTRTRGTSVTEGSGRTEKVRMTEYGGAAKTDKVPTNAAQLEIISGERQGEKIVLVMENLIGREKGNIRFTDKSVSREHARIRYSGGKYSINNVSLTNPTRVNGETISDERELSEGDEIQFGVIKGKIVFLK